MLRDLGIQISQIHDKLRFVKDKQFIPLVNILPKWLLPNHVTALRTFICLIWLPFAIVQPYFSQIIIFLFVYFLDLLDGAMARLNSQVTYLGEHFDHISDKFNNIIFLFLLGGLTNHQFPALKVFIAWDVISAGLLAVEYVLKLRKKEIYYAKEPLDIAIKTGLWAFVILKIAPIIL